MKRVLILILGIFLISLSMMSAKQSSYEIVEEKLVINIPGSSGGIYPSGNLYINGERVSAINFCLNQKCFGDIKIAYNGEVKPGNYSVGYYDFSNYEWRSFDFLIIEGANEEVSEKGADFSESEFGNELEENETSAGKRAFVLFFCRIGNLFNGEFESCVSNYL